MCYTWVLHQKHIFSWKQGRGSGWCSLSNNALPQKISRTKKMPQPHHNGDIVGPYQFRSGPFMMVLRQKFARTLNNFSIFARIFILMVAAEGYYVCCCKDTFYLSFSRNNQNEVQSKIRGARRHSLRAGRQRHILVVRSFFLIIFPAVLLI